MAFKYQSFIDKLVYDFAGINSGIVKINTSKINDIEKNENNSSFKEKSIDQIEKPDK